MDSPDELEEPVLDESDEVDELGVEELVVDELVVEEPALEEEPLDDEPVVEDPPVDPVDEAEALLEVPVEELVAELDDADVEALELDDVLGNKDHSQAHKKGIRHNAAKPQCFFCMKNGLLRSPYFL